MTPPNPDPAAKLLAGALEPGNTRLRMAGIMSAVSTASTAGGYFAVASIAQDLLGDRRGWPRERVWFLLLVGAAVARAAASLCATRLAAEGAEAVQTTLRDRLVEAVLFRRAADRSSAHLANALMDEVDRVGTFAERYEPARVASMVVPGMLLAVVFPLSWPVGLILLLCAPLPPLNLSVVGMGTAAVARRHADEFQRLSGYFLDRLRGLATLRALGAEDLEMQRIQVASRRLSEATMAVLRVAFIAAGVLEAVVTMALAVVATYVGLTLLGYVDVPGLPGQMTLRTGVFLLMLTPLFFQPMRALSAAYHERADALAAIESLAELTRHQPDAGPAIRQALRLPPRLEIEGLTVIFAGRETPALEAVTATVEPGELVGVTGASGAGKSTLLRVLSGDLEPTAGLVAVGGMASRLMARDSATWLGQHPYMFPGSLWDNIAVGSSGTRDAMSVTEAAEAAGLGDLLVRLPRGLETPVGEGGWGLSGGEAQRVALARTLLKQAPLLLLDEPTAHLDSASELAISEVIRTVAATSTTVVATHSPVLLAICDRVISLDRGRQTERIAPRQRALA